MSYPEQLMLLGLYYFLDLAKSIKRQIMGTKGASFCS